MHTHGAPPGAAATGGASLARHPAHGGGFAAVLVLLACGPRPAAALPPDFTIENGVPGVSFNNPVAMAFTPDGRILVAEKRGVVRVVRGGIKLPAPMWDGQREVLNSGDRGLLGIAVDPEFAANGHVYLLYTVDPDSNGVDDDDDAFGRLVRYRTSAADSNLLDPASRTVLLGATWREGIPSGSSSHAIGALRWGDDGSLLVTAGDGGQFNQVDAGGVDPGLFGPDRTDPAEDIGAFRAQSLRSLDGKVLRLDPATGHGYPSNPYFDGDPRSNRSRVWAYGLRNPFRFAVRPGSGSSDPAEGRPGAVFVGDVGWNLYEEIHVVASGGANLGWPCFEGPLQHYGYSTAAPASGGCAAGPTDDNPSPPVAPALYWHHTDPGLSQPQGLLGNCAAAGVFYTGDAYPDAYRGGFFFADFGAGWIQVARFDNGQKLVELVPFATGAQGPVDFAVDPRSGDVHFLSIYTGQIMRIRHAATGGGNVAPVAVAGATPREGPAPLAVGFTSAGSHDPDGATLTFAWSFGDGAVSVAADPVHDYTSPGVYHAVLTVTDAGGAAGRDTVRIDVRSDAAFPATPLVDSFDRPDGPLGAPWVGVTGGFAVEGQDAVTTSLPAWAVWDDLVAPPDQEAWVTFGLASPAAEHSLLLKVQGRSWADGHVKVDYDSSQGGVIVLTYASSQGWVRRGGPFAARFGPGDRLGARAHADGRVDVFRNGGLAGTATVTGWPHYAAGGRIGMMFSGGTGMRVREFGGGGIAAAVDPPPRAFVDWPPDSSFFATGDTVRLEGHGWDDRDAADALVPQWQVDLHHNNHIHPAEFVFQSHSARFLAADHDDGTGVWIRALYMVTDAAGHVDTARVDLFPEIDLAASAVWTEPNVPGTRDSATWCFTLLNRGRMRSPYVRWRLTAGGQVLDEGEERVEPLGSLALRRRLPPLLAAGGHVVRLEVDPDGRVVEPVETDNAVESAVVVAPEGGTVGVGGPPPALALGPAQPNPSRGAVRMGLDLPRDSAVSLRIYDVSGREVWSEVRGHAAGRAALSWDGRGRDGAAVGPGVYLAEVRVDDERFTRRIARIR
jgi:glucose/arabinose dehydrogenase